MNEKNEKNERNEIRHARRSGRGRAGLASARRAFTLLELLVTIGIIALLAGIVLAVSTSVIRNAERKQVEMMFQALDQAVAEFERARDQKISFKRPEDPDGNYDIVELNLTAPYLIVCLLNGMDTTGTGNNFRPLLLSHASSSEILKRIDPDFLRRDTNTAVPSTGHVRNTATAPRSELVDPWSNRIAVVFPGRTKKPGELGDVDGTVRTSDENGLGVCRDRRICFVSAGPDGRFNTREDNIYSYDLIWPVPAQN